MITGPCRHIGFYYNNGNRIETKAALLPFYISADYLTVLLTQIYLATAVALFSRITVTLT